MERKLFRLFDYQKFRCNDRLEDMIADVESRYGSGLSDEDLAFVNAAGEPTPKKPGASPLPGEESL